MLSICLGGVGGDKEGIKFGQRHIHNSPIRLFIPTITTMTKAMIWSWSYFAFRGRTLFWTAALWHIRNIQLIANSWQNVPIDWSQNRTKSTNTCMVSLGGHNPIHSSLCVDQTESDWVAGLWSENHEKCSNCETVHTKNSVFLYL